MTDCTFDVDFTEPPAPNGGFRLRDYQERWREAIRQDRRTLSRLLVEASTGTGKTSCFAAVAKEEWEHGGRTLVLENRDNLVRQTAARITKETGLMVDIEMAGDYATADAPIVVASVQSLTKQPRLLGFAHSHFSLVVADESHHALCRTWQRILCYFHYGDDSMQDGWEPPRDGTYEPRAHVLGFTATPEIGERENLGEFYQKLSVQYQYREAVKDGWLVPPVTKNIPLKIDIRGLRLGRTPNGSDFKPNDLTDRLVPVLEALAEQICVNVPDRKSICFVPSIECARLLAAAVSRHGLNGIFVSGECKDVDEKIAAFRAAGKGTVLCNAVLVCEGSDFPDVSCIIPARATKSVGFYRQQIGRGTRVLPGIVETIPNAHLRRAAIAASDKPDLLILDPLWISDRIDLCDAYDLLTDKPEVKVRMREAKDLSLEGLDQAERDLIKALEKEAQRHARREARTINPLEWSASVGDPGLRDWQPTRVWEALPPLDGEHSQLAFLRKQGIDVSGITTRGLAQKIITRIIMRYKSGRCSPRQLDLLGRLGQDQAQCASLTIKGAGALIDRVLAEKKARHHGPADLPTVAP